MSEMVQIGVQLALVVLVILSLICAYRMWVGPRSSDRLQALDLLTTLLIGIIVVLAVIESTPSFVDVGISLAAFAFIGTLAIARYIAEGKVF